MRPFGGSFEVFKVALGALRANTTRGILTTLGIVIGILGVVTTMTAANGLANRFKESVGVLGADVLYVSRMPWVVNNNWFEFRNRPNLTFKEVGWLERAVPEAVAVNPVISTERPVKHASNVVRNVDVVGTTDKHVLVSAAVPELGRFLTGFEVKTRKPVCVIGATLREGLFGASDPLNKEIHIGREIFRVIGVMEKQGNASLFDGPDFDSQVFIPITAFVKDFGDENRDFNIAVKAPAGERLADFEYRLIGEMRAIHRLSPSEKDDFSINKMDTLVGMFNRVMGVVLLIGMVITGISLFVGGIGVMNVMFVSVTERTREIGVRKALGARRRTILLQFLYEASIICLGGGVLGLALAYGVTEVIDRMLLPASISWGIVLVALVVAVGTGIVSGFVPAWRASRLDPVEALRYE